MIPQSTHIDTVSYSFWSHAQPLLCSVRVDYKLKHVPAYKLLTRRNPIVRVLTLPDGHREKSGRG